jgi:hypothetical protein
MARHPPPGGIVAVIGGTPARGQRRLRQAGVSAFRRAIAIGGGGRAMSSTVIGFGRRGLPAASIPWLLPRPALAQAGIGRVEAVRGEALAESPRGRRSLSPAMPVFTGETMETAEESRLVLRLGADTELRLGANVRLRLDRFLARSGGVLTLERGPALLDLGPEDRAGGAAIRSPFGLVAVRGTRVWAGPSNGVFGVFVARGSVLVIAADRTVELTAGQGSDIATPGAQPTPPVAWGPPRIAAALASVS